MKRKLVLTGVVLFTCCWFFFACNNEEESSNVNSPAAGQTAKDQNEVHGTQIQPGDVTLTTPLNQQWVGAGKNMYDVKCQGCHKLTDERVVGPGWSGVTKRREPHWIMNMITNVDMMLESDTEAQKLLEQCLVRMPNQNISKDESRQILEFMRSNDGLK